LKSTLRNVADEIRRQDEITLSARQQQSAKAEAAQYQRHHLPKSTAPRTAWPRNTAPAPRPLQASAKDSLQTTMQAAQDLASRMAEVSRLAAGIQDLLKINQAVEKSMTGLAGSQAFQDTMSDIRKHLSATTEFCNRMSKPRVITLREE
jgi:hypothetical protein